MSINRYADHILILPEDDANRQIANGFIQNLNLNPRAIQVLPIAGGWTRVVEKFTNDHVNAMRKYPKSMIVLLIDFDNCEDRLSYVESHIPKDLIDRVFVLGVKSNPESLRRETNKSFETIGEDLANDCSESRNELWTHPLLIHNQPQLEQMILSVKPFLFNNN